LEAEEDEDEDEDDEDEDFLVDDEVVCGRIDGFKPSLHACKQSEIRGRSSEITPLSWARTIPGNGMPRYAGREEGEGEGEREGASIRVMWWERARTEASTVEEMEEVNAWMDFNAAADASAEGAEEEEVEEGVEDEEERERYDTRRVRSFSDASSN